MQGGNLGGTIDPQLNTATMEVDYVAHCVQSELNEFQQCNGYSCGANVTDVSPAGGSVTIQAGLWVKTKEIIILIF